MGENNTTFSLHNATDVASDSTTLGVLYLVTSLLVMVSNGIVMIVVVTSRELHLPTLWNITFMALCDFSLGLYHLVVLVPSAFMMRFAFPKTVLVPFSSLALLIIGQNVLNVALATIDRYLSVCWPLNYTQLMTGKRFIITIVCTVIINVCRVFLVLFPKADVYYDPEIVATNLKSRTVRIAAATVGFLTITVVVILGFLLKILWELGRSRQRVHSSTTDTINRQFTIAISLSTGVFLLSFVPTAIVIIWQVKYGLTPALIEVMKFAGFCVLSNSLWNVVIYSGTYKPFRDAFLRVFCKTYYRRKRQREVMPISLNNRTRGNE